MFTPQSDSWLVTVKTFANDGENLMRRLGVEGVIFPFDGRDEQFHNR